NEGNQAWSSRRFCNTGCAAAAIRRDVSKQCAVCGKQFTRTSTRETPSRFAIRKYCSKKCRIDIGITFEQLRSAWTSSHSILEVATRLHITRTRVSRIVQIYRRRGHALGRLARSHGIAHDVFGVRLSSVELAL